jgi:RNA-directed DNA polymerase
MKRVGNLFDAIADRTNLQLAVWRAMRGKRRRPEVEDYVQRLDDRLAELAEGLRAGTFPVGRFQQFVIRDPKERVITAPCFAERVLHHAIMNVCEPYFERWLIADTFACRLAKGRQSALRRGSHFARKYDWFLSMDVRRYFDSICHETLKTALARRIKDARLLALMGRIIDSYRGALGRGLPIGSLTSQHFANFYLDRFDRFIKEGLRIRAYVRYMDDMVIWGEGRSGLNEVLASGSKFLADELGLEFKPTPFINRTAHGLDFLGARLFPKHMTLNRRSRLRYQRRLRDLDCRLADDLIDEREYQQRATALTAFASMDGISSWRFRRKVLFRSEVGGQTARTE